MRRAGFSQVRISAVPTYSACPVWPPSRPQPIYSPDDDFSEAFGALSVGLYPRVLAGGLLVKITSPW